VSPAFYGRPTTIDQLLDHQVGRLLDLFGLEAPKDIATRWKGPKTAPTD
jgi:4-hydroxy-3-polyprenylbenzoate decarboxylase